MNSNASDFEDAAEVLAEVALDRREVGLPGMRFADPAGEARARVLRAYEKVGRPVFLVESALVVNTAPGRAGEFVWMDAGRLGEEQFCRDYQGTRGVVANVLAYTPDGVQNRVFQRDMPGVVTDRPRGTSGAGFESVWIPHGYRRTVAELRSYNRALGKRKRLYFDLAGHLGLRVSNDLYEAHVTVDGDGTTYDVFRRACDRLNVKAIHIELPNGTTPSHLITASFHQGLFATVLGEIEALADDFRACGFRVTRLKIEALIRNALVPATDEEAESRPRSNYFEFHVKVGLRDLAGVDRLRALCLDFGAHLSRNASNTMPDGVPLRFATFRVYGRGRDYAVESFHRFLAALRDGGYSLSNVLQEYTVYDTNVTLDDGWFPADGQSFCFNDCRLMIDNACPLAESVDYLLPPVGLGTDIGPAK